MKKTYIQISPRLEKLLKRLPVGLRADWEGTNHYELQTPKEKRFWWLNLGDIDFESNLCETQDGQRLGLILDIAEELSKIYYKD